MNRYCASAAALLLLVCSVQAPGIESVDVDVSHISFGPFERDDETPVDSRATARLVGTRDVPMYVGSKFGVRMRIDAERGTRLQIASVWTFRPRARRGEESSAIEVAEERISVTNHEDVLIWRALAERDMVPGEWAVRVALIGVDDEPLSSIPLHERTFAMRKIPPEPVRDDTIKVEPSP